VPCAAASDYLAVDVNGNVTKPVGYTKGEAATAFAINAIRYRNTVTNDPYLTTLNARKLSDPINAGNDTLCHQTANDEDDGVQLIDLQVKVDTIVRSTTILKRSPAVPGGS
jgi:hypothetical protein